MICSNHGRPRELLVPREELKALLDYSCSLPTGMTEGKRWRTQLRRGGREGEREYKIGEVVRCGCCDEGSIGIAWAWALDPITREPHRGQL